MLDVRNLCRPGLFPVSLQLEAGECLALRGPSGAGKTLLLRAIADLDPSEGEVFWQGRDRNDLSGPDWRALVGYLPAEPGWWAETVGEHFLNWQGLEPILSRLGLPIEAKSWPMTRPSTGERLRLALIRALERQPKVLLLDEPTAALDAKSVAVVEALVAEKQAAGLAVLWVSHDEGQGGRVASRTLRIESGRAWAEEA